jgi:hypothetical protein
LNPSYGIESPFVQFAAIPAEARYRFIIENGEMLVGGITYGPVCNGQTATYAVKDQFWVVWLDPDHDPSVRDPLLSLDGPAALMDRSVFGNGEYIEAFARTKQRLFPDGWSLDAIWDGGNADGSQDNPNAWLTVLRHETNVSVLQGARGGMPRSLWLMSYAGFERMYYDTVAGFAYWEGDPKKLETLLFFNMVRQDFEDAFLSLLPRRYREHIRDSWTRGIGALGLAAIPFPGADQPTRIEIEGNEPLAAIVAQLADRLGPTISKLPDPLNPSHKPKVDLADPMPDFAAFERAFSTLTATDDQRFIRFLPSATVIRVNDGDKHRVYSLIVNRVYASQYTLIFQNGQALPSEDTISLYPTIVNGFPNLFVDLDLESAPGFITDLTAVETADAWARFERRYVILRNSEAFWPFYDWINAWNFAERGDAAGWLDLHYYDAPER